MRALPFNISTRTEDLPTSTLLPRHTHYSIACAIFFSPRRTVNMFSLGRSTMFHVRNVTRSQAVTRIADRSGSQHLRGSRDVIGHLTI